MADDPETPDGRWVAFFTADALKKVPLAGGNALTLVDDINGGVWGFGTWTDSDEIVFTTSGREDPQRVSAEGGPVESLMAVSRGTVVRTPHFLPGTRTVLFTTVGEGSSEPRIEALDLDSGDRRIVIDRGSQPLYLESGYLLWVRDGNMVAAPFDADRLLPTGRVVPLGDGIRTDGPNPGTEGVLLQIAASRTGTLAYVPPPEEGARLGIVSRDGRFEAFGPEIHNPRVALPRVSPDGRAIAFADGTSNDSQIYLHDLVRGSTDPLTQTGANMAPTWHPSGRSPVLFSDREPEPGTYQRELTGTERFLLRVFARGASWSPDGSMFAYALQDGGNYDIWVASPDDPSSARPLIEGPAAEYSPRLSPDWRWLAYVSDESGRSEVYVRRYPEGERLRVSTEGGLGALWSPEGGELFLQAGTFEGVGDFMAVSVVQEGETPQVGYADATVRSAFPERRRDVSGVRDQHRRRPQIRYLPGWFSLRDGPDCGVVSVGDRPRAKHRTGAAGRPRLMRTRSRRLLFRALSSAGSERLPYKRPETVGGRR